MAAHVVSKLLAVCLLLGLVAACGRAGLLEPPPTSSSVSSTDQSAEDNKVEDKPFILDGLL